MSAFVVNRHHIDCLVRTALHGPVTGWSIQGYKVGWVADPEAGWQSPTYYRQLEQHNASNIGQMLEDECIASVSYRYQDTPNPDDLPGTIGDREGPFEFSGLWGRRLTAVEALKALSCYEYQSCEHPGWEESEAFRFCQVLRDALIGELPGYDAAEWELREPTRA